MIISLSSLEKLYIYDSILSLENQLLKDEPFIQKDKIA